MYPSTPQRDTPVTAVNHMKFLRSVGGGLVAKLSKHPLLLLSRLPNSIAVLVPHSRPACLCHLRKRAKSLLQWTHEKLWLTSSCWMALGASFERYTPLSQPHQGPWLLGLHLRAVLLSYNNITFLYQGRFITVYLDVCK